MQPDDCKSLVETLSKVIDARAKTTEPLFRAEIQAAEERLRAEILVSRAEAKADHLQLAGKVIPPTWGQVNPNSSLLQRICSQASVKR